MQTIEKQTTKEKPLTVKGAAELLGLSPKWVYCNYEKIPHYRFNSAIRFDRDELISWMERQHVEPKAV